MKRTKNFLVLIDEYYSDIKIKDFIVVGGVYLNELGYFIACNPNILILDAYLVSNNENPKLKSYYRINYKIRQERIHKA